METSILKLGLIALQYISARILGNKKHYLNAPDEVLNWRVVHYIHVLGHLIPTLILTVVISLKLLPLISTTYSKILEENGAIIPIVVFICFIPTAIINGIVIEKWLMFLKPNYKAFVSE